MTSSERRVTDALVSAAQVLTNRSLYAAAVGVYSKVVTLDSTHSMDWYGLGEAIFRQSSDTPDPNLLLAGLACVRRALVEDKGNIWAQRLEGAMQARTPLTAEQSTGCEPFTGDAATLGGKVGFSATTLADGVEGASSWEERMLLMSWLGRHQDDDFAELLLRGARDDNDQVQGAAIESLQRWIDRAAVRDCFEDLARAGCSRALTQQLAEALGRLRDTEHGEWAAAQLAELDG